MTNSIYSMTGFGSAEKTIGKTLFKCEVKSLNHRYLEIKSRLPRELQMTEVMLKQEIQKMISRGAIEFKCEKVWSSEESTPSLQLNLPLAKAVFESLSLLKKELNFEEPITLREISNYPDVFQKTQQKDLSLEEAWGLFQPLVKESIEKLIEMRKKEGASLNRFFHESISELKLKIDFLREKRNETVKLIPKKIEDKVTQIFKSFSHELIPQSIESELLKIRISQELSTLLEKSDIEEELTRFNHHLNHFEELLKEGGSVGKKVDFILQELNREINTLSNKSQDFNVSETVISIKVKLDQMREQGLNLE